jgi:glycosyltransferase involved in cell wall biosynthesis
MTDPTPEMRILQVLPALNEGGVEVGTLQMARYLHRQSIFNMVASSGGKMLASLEQIDVPHITLPLETKNPLKILLNAYRLKSAIKEHRITHVHARSRAPAWSAYIACSLINSSGKDSYVNFLTTFHGTYGEKPALKRWYNSVMLKGDAVIANSEFVKNHIAEVYGDTGKPMYVVHRGNDLERFDPAAVEQGAVDAVRQSMGANASTPLILMVGRLTAWKGQSVLLSALAELKDIPWVAAFAGSAENTAYKQQLERMVKDADIQDRIHLLGGRDDVPLLYRAADIAVSASTKPEAFGRVAIEAQAMETGIIATAHGGSLETVIDGETGFLVEPSNPAALKSALTRALTDLRKFADMGKAGRIHVCRSLTEEEMCRGETAVYVALCNSTAEKLHTHGVT